MAGNVNRSFLLGAVGAIALVFGAVKLLSDREEPKPPPPVRSEPPAEIARPEAAPQLALAPVRPSRELLRPALVPRALAVDDLEEAINGAIREGDDRPTGMVDRAQIRRAVTAVKPLLEQCFGDAAHRYPGKQEVLLRFTLNPDAQAGTLGRGELLKSSVADPWVEACVRDSLLDARFEPSPTPEVVTVTWPFRYEVGP